MVLSVETIIFFSLSITKELYFLFLNRFEIVVLHACHRDYRGQEIVELANASLGILAVRQIQFSLERLDHVSPVDVLEPIRG